MKGLHLHSAHTSLCSGPLALSDSCSSLGAALPPGPVTLLLFDLLQVFKTMADFLAANPREAIVIGLSNINCGDKNAARRELIGALAKSPLLNYLAVQVGGCGRRQLAGRAWDPDYSVNIKSEQCLVHRCCTVAPCTATGVDGLSQTRLSLGPLWGTHPEHNLTVFFCAESPPGVCSACADPSPSSVR